MSPVTIDEMTSQVRVVDRADIDPKLQSVIRKACEDVAKLEKERSKTAGAVESHDLVKALKTGMKAADALVDKCDAVEHDHVVKAMERYATAGRKRLKEIVVEDAKAARAAKADGAR
jgi:hypothetical protein